MVAPVEVGEGGLGLLVSNGLLKEHETRDRKAVGTACLAALERWSMGQGARTVVPGPRPPHLSHAGADQAVTVSAKPGLGPGREAPHPSL